MHLILYYSLIQSGSAIILNDGKGIEGDILKVYIIQDMTISTQS